jgi:hypothetical protein
MTNLKITTPSGTFEIPDSGYLNGPGTVCPKTPLHISEMTETDISKVLIEGDYATIMGVKYKRVAPATLYEVFANFGYSVDMCNAVVNAVEEWLPNELEQDEDLYGYIAGWNDCIDTVREGLR